jgi:pyruvate/2-oxoglutarate dehydrogenase complex dihydrolipoamide dehydrogenase (E3) component
MDVLVIGAGPAGVAAALRAADLGARTTLVTRGEFGGMAAGDGPVPVRTLAHAARLLREGRQFGRYGIVVGEPQLDYSRLLGRVREVVDEVRQHSVFRGQLESLGVTICERVGAARFTDPHHVETESGRKLDADRIILCTGGVSRRLTVPGSELTGTHSDAWKLTSVPPSMLVIGGGATGLQVASIFHAFGSRVEVFQTGRRILSGEDEDVSAAVAAAFREAGVVVHENLSALESFEKTPPGVRMHFSRDQKRESAEASLAVVAVGWTADTAELKLSAGGIETDDRGFVRVDPYLRTSAPHVFAAGDVTGRLLLVPPALQDGFVAATNAVRGAAVTIGDQPNPHGSFTDPEYARVGLTEAEARETHDVVTSVLRFDATTRTIIDGRTLGFCKLIADRATAKVLGCHVVGERAVEIVQLASIAMSAGMPVTQLARVPLSFPTYGGILGRVAARAAREINREASWQFNEAEDPPISNRVQTEERKRA